MTNFVRLVHFAWRYRVRFGLSIGCAAMVALLFFTELGAVYPLLHILFDRENPKRWVSERISSIENEIVVLDARTVEAKHVLEVADRHQHVLESLKERLDVLFEDHKAQTLALDAREHALGITELKDSIGQPPRGEIVELDALQNRVRLADWRLRELRECRRLLDKGGAAAISRRLRDIAQETADRARVLGRYRFAQPYIDQYLPNDSYRSLLLLMGLVVIGVALKGFFMFLQETLVASVMQLTLFDIRNVFFRRTINLDLASFSDQGSSELMTRFTNDMDSFGQGLNTLMSKVIREPLRFLSVLCGALWFNWRLTCLTLILVPISGATTYRVGKIMKRAVRRSLESMSTIYKILQESFQGIKVIKAFCTERVERRRFFNETKNLYRKSVRVAMIDAMSDPVLEMLTLSTVIIALLAGSYLVLHQTIYLNLGLFRLQLASEPMAIQDLLTLYAMLASAADPIRKLANVHSKIQRAAAAADRICGLMDRRPRVPENKRGPRLPRHRHSIEIEDVTFGYSKGATVLSGINLSVPHGETIALVGPNGCGKTTLMNLIPRFWEVDSGAIRIDGHDIREVQLRSLRSQIGMVIQETILFQDTIANNIAYGFPSARRADIERAAELAYAHQFIAALPHGYDTLIGERGYGLSGGQRQRIALARAMLRDPAILILDEATSAVDIQDELLIRKAIEEFAKTRTTFVISHSLASIQVADRIVLMDGGKIAAIGTDYELKRTSALYRRLHEIHYHRETA